MKTRPRARRPLPRAEVRALFSHLRQTGDPVAREELILAHESLAIYLARKFADRGEPLEDLIQVAQVGLIKAIDRYDPARGIEFTTYVTPTIVGEIKRYFRDKLWSIRVPRRLREVNYTLMRCVDDLSQRLGRSPTLNELAEETGVPFEVAIEALEAGRAYTPASLDAETTEEGGGDRAVPLGEMIGDEDTTIERLEDRATLEWALENLPSRHKEIVRLRFFDRLSQAEIARRFGISQMHVSRLQREALGQLRGLIAGRSAEDPA
ncbi:MAG TPA: SigB/SigF/SigG family RNA polymerase sigma factor [bacterium]|nr:SigB/SigF/SigG family RNA polymerase sigma factor [bacterium]